MKDKKPEILYSDQVNEIISNPPEKLVRWGTAVIFMVFIVIVLLAWLIKYPEVISSPVVITNSNLSVDSVSDIISDSGTDNSGEFIGRISLGIERWGKIAVGQKVLIKVSAFSYLEYGMLRGNVKSKTLTSGNEFELEVLLPEGLTTLYKKNLEFIPDMQGTAEIIIDDISLLQRIIKPPRHFISRNRK
jgi:hypothetical protein